MEENVNLSAVPQSSELTQSNDALNREAQTRELARRALDGAGKQICYLQHRVARNARDAALCEMLQQRLDEDAAARSSAGWGRRLQEELVKREHLGEERRLDAAEAPAPLTDEERKRIGELLKQHAPMSDGDALRCATTLADLALKLTAALPEERAEQTNAPPVVEIGRVREEQEPR